MKKAITIITSLTILVIMNWSCVSNNTQEENLYYGVFEKLSGELITDIPPSTSIGEMEKGETADIITYTCKDSDITIPYIYSGDIQAPATVPSFDNTPATIEKVILVSKTKI